MEKSEEKRDYSLLRPFDLEAAKRGEGICTKKESPMYFVAQSRSKEQVFICEYASFIVGYFYPDQLCMSPLAWVEGRPVYPGDELYWADCEKRLVRFVAGPAGIVNSLLTGASHFVDGDTYEDDGQGGCFPSELTWQRPKTKREVWVNLYEAKKIGSNTPFDFLGNRYDSREEADRNSSHGRFACVSFFVEE